MSFYLMMMVFLSVTAGVNVVVAMVAVVVCFTECIGYCQPERASARPLADRLGIAVTIE